MAFLVEVPDLWNEPNSWKKHQGKVNLSNTVNPLELTVIGRGKIASAVAGSVETIAGLGVVRSIGRGDAVPASTGLTIETAGPDALREHGPRALAMGDLWSVSASALLDEDLRKLLERIGQDTGHKLRLFTGWLAGPSLCLTGTDAQLFITQDAPLLDGQAPGEVFRGPLSEAGLRYPNHLNTATAAALCGPGISATHIILRSTPEGGAHRIAARMIMPSQTLRSEVRFDRPGPHPVAMALLAALVQRNAPFQYY